MPLELVHISVYEKAALPLLGYQDFHLKHGGDGSINLPQPSAPQLGHSCDSPTGRRAPRDHCGQAPVMSFPRWFTQVGMTRKKAWLILKL